MKNIKLILIAAIGLLVASCYNDFDTPAPRKIYTDADMEQLMGLERVDIAELKVQYINAFGSITGRGTNDDDNFETTNSLKFGAISADEAAFNGLKSWGEASNKYIKGKVISSDRQGNVYKSLHIFDGTSAIELKLYNGLYLDFALDFNNMNSQWVYVKLDGLFLGNYRMALSIGGAPSDSYNTAGSHKFYANSNLDDPRIASQNVFVGERVGLTEGTAFENDILVVTPTTYSQLHDPLTDAAGTVLVNSGTQYDDGEDAYLKNLGRLVRFQDIEIDYRGVSYEVKQADGSWTAVEKPVIKSGSNSNPYPNWIVTDYGTPIFGTWYYWAYNRDNVRLYGSVLMSYNTGATYNSEEGVYSIRTSGYSQFGMRPIPMDGSTGDVLGIYGIYAKTSDFSGDEYDWAQYQITVSRIEDLDFDSSDLLTDEFIQRNTPEASYNPPVKDGGEDGSFDS